MTLKELPIGKTATVRTVGGEGALRQHFLDMGIIPGAEVTMVKYAPMGDPVEVRIHSYELTLRLADAGRIAIDEMRDAVKEKEQPGIYATLRAGHSAKHPLPIRQILCGSAASLNSLLWRKASAPISSIPFGSISVSILILLLKASTPIFL